MAPPHPECSLCGDRTPDPLHIATNTVCHDCLIQLFTLASTDESHYPPRFGPQLLDIADYVAILPEYLQAHYRIKSAEFDIAPHDRLYCQVRVLSRHSDRPARPCDTYLGPRGPSSGTQPPPPSEPCPTCNRPYCSACGSSDIVHLLAKRCTRPAPFHHSDDTDDPAFASLRRGRDYQICPSRRCGRKIQLSEGCNHVECVCRESFCYVCGSPACAGSGHWSPEGCPRFSQLGQEWDAVRLERGGDDGWGRHDEYEYETEDDGIDSDGLEEGESKVGDSDTLALGIPRRDVEDHDAARWEQHLDLARQRPFGDEENLWRPAMPAERTDDWVQWRDPATGDMSRPLAGAGSEPRRLVESTAGRRRVRAGRLPIEDAPPTRFFTDVELRRIRAPGVQRDIQGAFHSSRPAVSGARGRSEPLAQPTVPPSRSRTAAERSGGSPTRIPAPPVAPTAGRAHVPPVYRRAATFASEVLANLLSPFTAPPTVLVASLVSLLSPVRAPSPFPEPVLSPFDRYATAGMPRESGTAAQRPPASQYGGPDPVPRSQRTIVGSFERHQSALGSGAGPPPRPWPAERNSALPTIPDERYRCAAPRTVDDAPPSTSRPLFVYRGAAPVLASAPGPAGWLLAPSHPRAAAGPVDDAPPSTSQPLFVYRGAASARGPAGTLPVPSRPRTTARRVDDKPLSAVRLNVTRSSAGSEPGSANRVPAPSRPRAAAEPVDDAPPSTSQPLFAYRGAAPTSARGPAGTLPMPSRLRATARRVNDAPPSTSRPPVAYRGARPGPRAEGSVPAASRPRAPAEPVNDATPSASRPLFAYRSAGPGLGPVRGDVAPRRHSRRARVQTRPQRALLPEADSLRRGLLSGSDGSAPADADAGESIELLLWRARQASLALEEEVAMVREWTELERGLALMRRARWDALRELEETVEAGARGMLGWGGNIIGADCLVSFGGGSTIGLGKALAIRTGLPHVCIPTMYAGSEMTPILGETADGRKTTRSDPKILPGTVIYDVDLTMTLPVGLSATSGVNAIAHAVEALYARAQNPITTLLALSGIRALASSLPTIVHTPTDPAARAQAQYGAWLCGTCLGSVGMSLHHKLCHTLGGTFNLPHAETHTIVLPHALAYNAPAIPEVMKEVAECLPGSEGDAIKGVNVLLTQLGVKRGLKEYGMKEKDVETAVGIAVASPYWNPRAIEEGPLRETIRRCWAGEEARADL
ncbi:hypothetical protein LTR53_000787 [Teratosphaeriaceae sp. CCFEE 6253]|nr:hypothetical protein LTR53_000787 [Teratosphaeriaceae sp. CCFEE 6253]